MRCAKFSILTPCFSAARFLPDALSSVRAQDAPIQHVVIDAGSSDGTVTLLERWDSDSVIWVSEPDQGQSDALNKALGLATGEFVGWLNADEWYLPGAIATVRSVFESRPDVDVVYGEYLMVDAQQMFLRAVPSHWFSLYTLKRYGCFVPSCATFIRRSALGQNPWNIEHRWIMDWDLWLQLATSGVRFHHIRKPLAAFTVHANQVTAGDRRARAHEWDDLRRRYGIHPRSGAGWRLVAARLTHSVQKLLDGAYFRQWRASTRYGGRRIEVG